MAGMPRRRSLRICGAFARSTGKPCQRVMLGRGGRCPNHGGRSLTLRDKERITRKTGRTFKPTGPKTPEGWKRWFDARDAGRDRYFAALRKTKLAD